MQSYRLTGCGFVYMNLSLAFIRHCFDTANIYWREFKVMSHGSVALIDVLQYLYIYSTLFNVALNVISPMLFYLSNCPLGKYRLNASIGKA